MGIVVLRSSWHANSSCTSSRNRWNVVPAAARRRFSVRVEMRRVAAASSTEGRRVVTVARARRLVSQPAGRERDRGVLVVEPGCQTEELPERRQVPWGGELGKGTWSPPKILVAD